MRTKTVDARAACAEVLRAAEAIRSDAPEAIPTMSPGDVVRQGDLYITCLAREPAGGILARSRQLAPGTTRGARHIVVGDCDVLRVHDGEAKAALQQVVPRAASRQFFGPVIRARGPVTVKHPEHGDRTLPGDAFYLVTYQRAWRGESREDRMGGLLD
jgi:hypothetical protein